MSDPYNTNGGGGFFQGGGGGSQSSQGGQRRRNDTLRPVTIKQLNEASQPHPDADFLIDDVDVGQITVVGVVRNIATQATNVSISLEDGTGACDLKFWLNDEGEDDPRLEGVAQDVYIRVIGSIKDFGNRRHLAATQVRAITDHNEIFFHLLESQYVHLVMRRGKPRDNSSVALGGGIAGGNAGDYAASGGGGGGGGLYNELVPLQRTIMQYVTSNPPEEGLHVGQIATKVTGYDTQAILDGIEELISDGHLYTTIDDEHVLPTS